VPNFRNINNQYLPRSCHSKSVLTSCSSYAVVGQVFHTLYSYSFETGESFSLGFLSKRNIPAFIAFHSRLGGVVVRVLATGRKGRGFKPSRVDGLLRTIKIRSTPSFGWEIKPEVPSRKILRHVKDPLTYQRY
jgi:hypothetical protein